MDDQRTLSPLTLHGITTAMMWGGGEDWEWEWGVATVRCPCGWSHDTPSRNMDDAAIRFHYTHCPEAKV